jgi:hypothetical protein
MFGLRKIKIDSIKEEKSRILSQKIGAAPHDAAPLVSMDRARKGRPFYLEMVKIYLLGKDSVGKPK